MDDVIYIQLIRKLENMKIKRDSTYEKRARLFDKYGSHFRLKIQINSFCAVVLLYKVKIIYLGPEKWVSIYLLHSFFDYAVEVAICYDNMMKSV